METTVRTAILVIGFNRPEHLARVLQSVRDAGPPRVYIAIDGARTADEEQRVEACRDVARAVDWAPCELRLRTRNLGCQRGVIDAVTWMLEREEAGVIVEDDSLPAPSFFPFCDELLERYRDDDNVLAISGESRVPPQETDPSASYRLTYMGPAGAWATWRDRWVGFTMRRVDRSPVSTFTALRGSRYGSTIRRAHWMAIGLANRTRVMDSWAYPFMIDGAATRRLTATPNVNLVSDHGMGAAATHMQAVDTLQQPASDITFPLRHPARVAVDERAERWSEEHEVGFGVDRLARHGAAFCRRLTRRR